MNYEKAIRAMLAVIRDGVGTGGRTIDAGTFNVSSHPSKSDEAKARDSIWKPTIDIDDFRLASQNRMSDNISPMMTDFTVRFTVTYHFQPTQLADNKIELMGNMLDDADKIRKSMTNPGNLESYNGESTGLIGDSIRFASSSGIAWKANSATHSLTFSGIIATDQ
jgi:hypothetical protein